MLNAHRYGSCTGAGSGILDGLCPLCLLRGALESAPPSLESPAEALHLPDYELRRKIAEGGEGEVWEAWQISLKRLVALKLIKGRTLASAKDVRRFITEAEAAARQKHPSSIPIHAVSEHEGLHYFTMDLMSGGSLSEHMTRFRENPRRTAELLETIAKAVHISHRHGILHRDLKPANILLDEHDKPYVTDFGVAIPIHRVGLTEIDVIVGTPEYMSPEQAKGGTTGLTTATDVYGLGAILYHILTGRPPFEGKTSAQIREQVIHCPPMNPREIDRTVDRDLETICLKCLEKDPADRYGSAEDLASTLRRYLNYEPIGRVSHAERVRRWARRRPITAAALLGVIALAVGVIVAALSVGRAQETELRQETQRMNEYAARAMAGSVLFQLDKYAEQIARIAEDPAVLAAIRAGGCHSNEGAERLLASLGAGTRFASLILHDAQGVATRRWPSPPAADFLCKDFSWLTYYSVARAHGERGSRSVTVSRVFRSEADGQWRFGLAAPVLDEQGRFVGVVGAGMVTNSRLGTADDLGSLVVGFPGGDTRRTTVLVGPRDNDRNCRDCPLPEDSLVLLQQNLAQGHKVPMNSAMVRGLQERVAAASPDEAFRLPPPDLVDSDDHHIDPFDGQRWIAGAAPVGATGYVAIVQTRWDAAVEPNARLARRLLAVGAGAAVFTAIAAVLLALWSRSRANALAR